MVPNHQPVIKSPHNWWSNLDAPNKKKGEKGTSRGRRNPMHTSLHGDMETTKSPSPGSNRNRLAIDISVLPGKSPFLIGKPSINGPFSMAMLNNQRVNENKIPQNPKKNPVETVIFPSETCETVILGSPKSEHLRLATPAG